MSEEKKKERKKEKPKKTKKLFIGLVTEKRKIVYELLPGLKVLWCDLQRLSSRRLEINLCAHDFMANAFLALLFTNWGIQGAQITVNYLDENWLIFYFASHLWVLMWLLLKLVFSPPVLKLGLFMISSKFKNT